MIETTHGPLDHNPAKCSMAVGKPSFLSRCCTAISRSRVSYHAERVLLVWWISGLIVVLGLLPFVDHLDSLDNRCRPDNSFNFEGSKLSVWRMDNPFDVTIGFGRMTFSQVKLIDISWDIVGSIS
jgi:hypothetical protein